MKLISLNCPNCSAHLTIAPDKTEARCEHCGTTFLIDDENIHIDFDAEQAGYDFEKGRQRAQEESVAEERGYIDEETTEGNELHYEKDNSEHVQYEKVDSGRKVAPWVVLGIVILLLIATLGKCGSKPATHEDASKTEEPVAETTEETEESVAEMTEETEEGILNIEDEELSEEPVATHQEPEDNPEEGEIKGRGFSDVSYKEPNYVGLSGYVSIYKYDEPLLSFYEVPQGPWIVPKYALYEGKHIDTNEKVEHKTQIKVLEQSLFYEDVAKYGGYLLVEDESGEQFYIDVDNFVVKDYWNNEDLVKALEVGYYLAEYHQKSSVSPVTHDNEEVELEEGTLVFVRNFVPEEWSVITDKPHPDTTPIEGLVWGGWYDFNEYGARGICFNTEDLTIVY